MTIRRFIIVFVSFAFFGTFCIPSSVLADKLLLPKPGAMIHLSPAFTPAHLKGIVIHPKDPFKFDFIIHRGDTSLTDSQKREQYNKLAKYFLASLAIPDEDQWVNLSPYEKERIVKDNFGKTVMGRDLLAQDYLLKQITASLIYPQDKLGKTFWDKVYKEAQEKYGTANVPVNTFNKVWILPDDALIYEKGNTAYVLKLHLRVLLEEDYLSLQKHSGIAAGNEKINTVASQIIREIVLPELQKEVNEGRNFAPLRQVYSGMLLATWFKRTLKQSVLGQVYANKGKVKGIDQDPSINEEIYQQYLKAYRKGVFNFIKDDTGGPTNKTMPRKYFSGGTGSIEMAERDLHRIVLRTTTNEEIGDQAMAAEISDNDMVRIALVHDRAMNSNEDGDAAALRLIDPELEVLYRSWGISFIDSHGLDGLQKMVEKGANARVVTPEGELIHNRYGISAVTFLKNNFREKDSNLARLLQEIGKLRDFIYANPADLLHMTLGAYVHPDQREGLDPSGALTAAETAGALDKFSRTTHGQQVRGGVLKGLGITAAGRLWIGVYPQGGGSAKDTDDPINALREAMGFKKQPYIQVNVGTIFTLDAVKLGSVRRLINEFQDVEFGLMETKEVSLVEHENDLLINATSISTVNLQEGELPLPSRAINAEKSKEDRAQIATLTRSLISIQRKINTLEEILYGSRVSEIDAMFAFRLRARLDELQKERIRTQLTLEYGEIKIKNRPSELDSADEALPLELYPNRVTLDEIGDYEGWDYLDRIKEMFKRNVIGLFGQDVIPDRKSLEEALEDVKDRSEMASFLIKVYNSFGPKYSADQTRHQRLAQEITVEIFRELLKGDAAMLIAAKSEQVTPGGIDLNSANLNLRIKRDGNGMPLPLAEQDLALLSNIQGLAPIIISIQPARQAAPVADLRVHP